MNSRLIFSTTSKQFAVELYFKCLDNGYTLIKSYSKKKLFKKRCYFIEMLNYSLEIEKAISEERYEDVIQLKKEQNGN